MHDIQIRETPLEDIWLMRQVVMYPAETLDFVKLEDDDKGLHFGLYVAGRLVSVISVFEKENEVQFRKFATARDMQGKGYGTRLLQYVMDWAVDKRKKIIWCNARLMATEMYRKFGMHPSGDSWKKYGIEFIKMQKQLM